MAVTRAEVIAFTKRLRSQGFSVTSYDADVKVMERLDERAGPGLAVGRVLRFPFADGYALYMVSRINAKTVSVEHIALGDAWHVGFIEYAGGKVPLRQAQDNVTQADRLRALFKDKPQGMVSKTVRS